MKKCKAGSGDRVTGTILDRVIRKGLSEEVRRDLYEDLGEKIPGRGKRGQRQFISECSICDS